MNRAGLVFSLLILLCGTGCEALLGPPDRALTPISLSIPALVGSWRGTWRNTLGASGELILRIDSAGRDRVSGVVQFAGAMCTRSARLDDRARRENGGMPARSSLILTADLGPPCGKVTLSIVESRSEVPRLVGSYRTEYPESGLFAIYPR